MPSLRAHRTQCGVARVLLNTGCLACAWTVMLAGSDGPATRKTNIDIFREHVRQAVHEFSESTALPSGESITLWCAQGEERWLVEQAATESLRESGYRVFSSADSANQQRHSFALVSTRFAVRYEDVFRDGLFGAKHVRRSIRSTITAQAVAGSTGETIYSRSSLQESLDTVLVDDVPLLEDSAVRSTHAELPSEGLLDRIVEPFVVLGATGVAIYLFFRVRS